MFKICVTELNEIIQNTKLNNKNLELMYDLYYSNIELFEHEDLKQAYLKKVNNLTYNLYVNDTCVNQIEFKNLKQVQAFMEEIEFYEKYGLHMGEQEFLKASCSAALIAAKRDYVLQTALTM